MIPVCGVFFDFSKLDPTLSMHVVCRTDAMQSYYILSEEMSSTTTDGDDLQ